MKKRIIRILSIACLFSILMVSGCVAPPKETTPLPTPETYAPDVVMQPVTPVQNQNLLAEATPFGFRTTPTFAYSTLPPVTQIPGDIVCLIDYTSYNWTFESNITAKKFDLKNPPLYINYSISDPFNVSGTHLVTSHSGTEQTVAYSYYSPYSYLEITIRDPATGTIFTDDGFGKNYGEKLNNTIQVRQSGNLLIEIQGNNVTPSIGVWAKPSGNFDPASVNFTTRECRSQQYVMNLNQ